MPPRKKTQPAELKAGEGRCQEASTLSGERYIPCNAPAVALVGWKGRDEKPIRMCAMCEYHNIKNRNGYRVSAIEGAPADQPAPAGHNNPPSDRPAESDEVLIAENFRIEDLIKAATAKLNEWAAPHKERLKLIEDELFRRLAERQADSTRTDAGTAYISHITNFKIEDREPILDFMLDNWEQPDWGGVAMMTFNVTKDAVKAYMDQHNGQLPPGLSISHFNRLNIKRS